MRCRFSHLKKACAPVRASNCVEVATGVRWATPSSRAAAAATSAYVTGADPDASFTARTSACAPHSLERDLAVEGHVQGHPVDGEGHLRLQRLVALELSGG